MRLAFVLTLMLLLTPITARAVMCDVVHEKSMNRIACVQDDFGFSLKYLDLIIRPIVMESGMHSALIDSLCYPGGVVRETWPVLFRDPKIVVTHCDEEEET